MMSAPARRIAYSVSHIARASSSIPRAAAALIIAYSPLTWYAASGEPNSCLARRIRSRQGSAGFTRTMSAPSSASRRGRTLRGLHQDNVRPLLDVEPDLAHRLVGVGSLHLVGLAIAELGGRAGRFAERPIERRRHLCRVRHDRQA